MYAAQLKYFHRAGMQKFLAPKKALDSYNAFRERSRVITAATAATITTGLWSASCQKHLLNLIKAPRRLLSLF